MIVAAVPTAVNGVPGQRSGLYRTNPGKTLQTAWVWHSTLPEWAARLVSR